MNHSFIPVILVILVIPVIIVIPLTPVIQVYLVIPVIACDHALSLYLYNLSPLEPKKQGNKKIDK